MNFKRQLHLLLHWNLLLQLSFFPPKTPLTILHPNVKIITNFKVYFIGGCYGLRSTI